VGGAGAAARGRAAPAGAAEALEPSTAATSSGTALVRIYEIRLEAASDGPERLLIGKRLGRIHEEQKEDLDGAFRWYSRVFRDEPNDAHNLRHADASGQRSSTGGPTWPSPVAHFDTTTADDDPTLRVGQILGRVYDERLHDLDKAEEVYRRL